MPNIDTTRIAKERGKTIDKTKVISDSLIPKNIHPCYPWRIVGARVRGDSHRNLNSPCQDYFGFSMDKKSFNIAIACIADGAGSASHGHLGAKLMVKSMLKGVTRQLPICIGNGDDQMLPQEAISQHLQTITRSALVKTYRKFLQVAQKIKRTPKDFATTLSLLVVGPNWHFGCQIGDGTIVTRQEHGCFTLLIPPARGPHANETDLFPQNCLGELNEGYSSDATSSIRWCFEPLPLHFFCLSSDGIEPVAFVKPTWTPSPGFFTPLEDHIRQGVNPLILSQELHGFLKSNKLRQRTDDDRTILVGIPSPSGY